MKFETTILGCGSATPTMRHQPTSQLVEHNGHYLLFDCGEGTQLQLRRYSLKFQKINHIFITHTHGDHCLGLPGLISTMHLLGRTRPLHIYSAPELKEAVDLQLRVSHSRLRFELEWHATDPVNPSVLLESKAFTVSGFPLVHRVPCTGFLITENDKPRHMRAECIDKYDIPFVRIRQIKQGADFVMADGKIIPNSELTFDPDPPRSYAFCTDTAYSIRTAEYIRGVDVVYHESTFLEGMAERASETFHSTARQAAKVASQAGAGQLVLGHYSARYRCFTPFLEEAKTEFDNTILATEGLTISIGKQA